MQAPSVSTPSTNSKWEQLVARMPRPDPEEKILKNVEEGQVEKVAAELYAGGREAVTALVDMLTEPGGERNDSPVRHALHALVIHAGRLGDEQRRALGVTLASALGSRERSTGVRAFLVRQLQLCGGAEVAPALGKLLRDEALYPDAAMALLAVRDGAAEQFRAALPDVAGPQRVAVIQALGTLKDAESAEPLRRAAERDPDPVARLEAAWALANIGDPAAPTVVLKIADETKGFDRARATKACLLLAENLAAAGRKKEASLIYRHLQDTRADASEAYVRELAERALRS
jgi:HEAT repeat protein